MLLPTTAGTRTGFAPPTPRWSAPTLLGHLALLAAGALTACEVRAFVASERLSDQASIVLTVGTALALAGSALGALQSAAARRRSGRAASLALSLGLAAICAAFVRTSLVDTSVEMQALVAAGGPPSPPPTIEVGPGGREIRFEGDFVEGAAGRLARILATHRDIARIELTSDGGLAEEGQAIGNLIAASGLATAVPDHCISACTLAFVRGRERLVREGARLGFHSPYEEGLFGTIYQGDSSEERAFYIAAGVDAGFVDAALKVNPETVWYPPFPQLLAAHVVTAAFDEDQIAGSTIGGSAVSSDAQPHRLERALHPGPVEGRPPAR